jgi:hypothetical protein
VADGSRYIAAVCRFKIGVPTTGHKIGGLFFYQHCVLSGTLLVSVYYLSKHLTRSETKVEINHALDTKLRQLAEKNIVTQPP